MTVAFYLFFFKDFSTVCCAVHFDIMLWLSWEEQNLHYDMKADITFLGFIM